jgi:Ca-activated chloride channel family protein
VIFLYLTHPLVLLLLLPLPVLAWWQLRQRKRAVEFPADALMRGLPTGRAAFVRTTSTLARILALALLIIALAGPRWPDEGSRIPTEGMSIALVVDVSQSMTDKDFLWQGQPTSRLQAAKEIFKLFVQGGTGPGGQQFSGRDNDLLSLVAFADYPENVCPLTLDHRALIKMLDAQEARTQEWTDIGDAIAFSLATLEKSGKGKKALVLLTDGEQTKYDAKLKPRQAAQLAGNLGIPIYAIDVGKDPGQTPDAPSDEIKKRQDAKKIMQVLADITKGRYFHASDADALLEVCRQIDEMERQEIESFEYRRFFQAFAWFSLGSLAMLSTILTLEMTVWRRLP